ESGKSKMPLDFGILLLRHARFRKYRDWFLFDEVEPKAGQVVPALAHIGQSEAESSHSGKKTG
ncbi:TPA: XRE family transcriptional regulator, partial [Escherichia coli]